MFIGSPNVEMVDDRSLVESSECQHPSREPRRRRPASVENALFSPSRIALAVIAGATAVVVLVALVSPPDACSHLVDCFRNLVH